MDEFYLKSRIYLGKDGLKKTLEGITKVLIVTDKFMYESGKVTYVTEQLEQQKVVYQIFHEIKPDPDIGTVSQGISQMLVFKPQMLIAFGGGSAIDTAKAMKLLAAKQGVGENYKLIALPTTSGTGSEVSRFTVISDIECAAKYPLVSDEVLPEAAVLDAQLVMSVPPKVTADTGIDVLTHAMEAYVSDDANDFTDAAAEKAVCLVKENLVKVYREPNDLEARQKMHHASCLAGIAFSNAGLGLNHAMAHTLGAHFHIPHGRANGILMPYVMGFNTGCFGQPTSAASRYAKLAGVLRLEGTSERQSVFNLLRHVKQYIRQLDIPKSIEAAGVSKETFEQVLDAMTNSALHDSCIKTNPRKCSAEEIRMLFQKAYSGN